MMNFDNARASGGEMPEGWKPKKSRPSYETEGKFAEDDNEFPGDWRVKQSKSNRRNGNDDAPAESDMDYADDDTTAPAGDNESGDGNGAAKAQQGEKFKFWRDSPYEVSNKGRIRRGDKILKPRISSRGFAYLNASYSGKNEQPSYHSMVLELFGPKKPKGIKNPVIAHKNNKKTDNRIENLSYQSNADNTQDAYSDGLYKDKGANNKEWREKNGQDGSKTGKKRDPE